MDEIYKQWHSSLRAKQKKRTYKHFDAQLDLNNDQHLEYVVHSIENIKAHQFLPLIKFIKKDTQYKRNGDRQPARGMKLRPLMYASHLDAHIYSFYAYKWSALYEKFLHNAGVDTNVIAYRRITDGSNDGTGKNNIQFAHELFSHIQNKGDCVVIIADIKSFFDTLKHKVLKECLCAILNVESLPDAEYKVLQSLTSFRFVLKTKSTGKRKGAYSKFWLQLIKKLNSAQCSTAQAVYESGRGIIKTNKKPYGIPQGTPVSGLLANIYLSDFDQKVANQFPDCIYRRYSDDIAIICSPDVADEALLFLKEQIKDSALTINDSKIFRAKFQKNGNSITCTEVKDGNGALLDRKYLNYLGFEFDGSRVFLKGGTLQRMYRKSKRRIKKFHARQTNSNPRKPHRPRAKISGRTYIDKARKGMDSIGTGIAAQHKKERKHIRKSKHNAKNNK